MREYVHHDVSTQKVFEEKKQTAHFVASCSSRDALMAGNDPAEACPLQALGAQVGDKQNEGRSLCAGPPSIWRAGSLPEDRPLSCSRSPGAGNLAAPRFILDPGVPRKRRATQRDGDQARSAGSPPRVGVNYNLSPEYGICVRLVLAGLPGSGASSSLDMRRSR